jgi:hypothetical protein
MLTFMSGARLRFPYTNHKNITEVREVTLEGLQYGSNQWYPKPQWFIRCWDSRKKDTKIFALNKIDPSKVEVLL